MSEFSNIPPLIRSETFMSAEILERQNQMKNQQQQVEELRRIADSTQEQLKVLKEQLDLQIKESHDAKRDVRTSKILSIIAIIASAIFAILPLIF